MSGPAGLTIVRDVAGLRTQVKAWRAAGRTIALVPTMGALHRGHIQLMETARAKADAVIATIFVNPTQFGPNEDFGAYPRQEGKDASLLTTAGVDALFAPSPSEMYPAGFATKVSVAGLTDVLCGPFRPGHFEGVATVVTKLLLQALPDVALFGEKDFQQLAVIKRFTADLDIPVKIIGVPTVREADGLAMSSRNAYLSAEERAIAPMLFAAISKAAAAISKGAEPAAAVSEAKDAVLRAGFRSVDYIEARRSDTLSVLKKGEDGGRVFAAAYLGRARLIDNVAVG
ncbi:MAG: pantoate--beta-alanine ligase [Rhodospirillaceae bacterium]|nr:pantoate--beta-alanine ligase [Rhodospirillaceae bacterium]